MRGGVAVVAVAVVVMGVLFAGGHAGGVPGDGAVVAQEPGEARQEREEVMALGQGDAAVAEQVQIVDAEDPSDDDPTWRELGKDESVVPGSHVRMNLSTGRKWVKLDEVQARHGITKQVEDDASCAEDLHEKPEEPADQETSRQAMMERVLYSLPEPDERLPSREQRAKMSPEEYEEALQKIWAHRQAEIKAAMEAMDDHGSIIRDHLQSLVNDTLVPEEIVQVLEDLEYQVQDIDHATSFVKLGGLDVLRVMLEDDDAATRTGAAFVLGSAVKNLGDLQTLALTNGLLSVVCHRVRALVPTLAAHSDEMAKLLYAFSSMLRGHEAAQERAKDLLDLTLLLELLEASEAHPRVLAKALAMVEDSFSAWPGFEASWGGPQLCDVLRALSPSSASTASHQALALAAAGCA